jgi:hypothetical protein
VCYEVIMENCGLFLLLFVLLCCCVVLLCIVLCLLLRRTTLPSFPAEFASQRTRTGLASPPSIRTSSTPASSIRTSSTPASSIRRWLSSSLLDTQFSCCVNVPALHQTWTRETLFHGWARILDQVTPLARHPITFSFRSAKCVILITGNDVASMQTIIGRTRDSLHLLSFEEAMGRCRRS